MSTPRKNKFEFDKYNFTNKIERSVISKKIHFFNLQLLKKYLTPVQKIMHSRFSKLTRRTQDRIAREIKIARQMALLPFKF